MRKKILILGVLFLVLLPRPTKALTFDNAYRAIVKIYTYYEDGAYNLSSTGTGSGVIIDSSGIILTNYHVVHVEGEFENELPSAYRICLTLNATKKPECNFSADLIAKDKEKDIALLKIRKTSISDQSIFDSIERATEKNFKTEDAIEALGYPSSGGETITGALGSIIGTYEKFNLNWIKTNAAMSFGSSGGAMIDAKGRLIGITSGILEEVGYAIDINSLNLWINSNISNQVKVSSIQNRMNDLIVKQKSLEKSSEFLNKLPGVKLTKPTDWEFVYIDENNVYAYNPNEKNGGVISIAWGKSDTNAAPLMDITVDVLKQKNKYIDLGKITVSGIEGRKMLSPLSNNEEEYHVLLPLKNYFITLVYYYGEKDKDKSEIEDIISKVSITDEGIDFKEQKTYENSDPYFKISLPDDYSLMPVNNVAAPVTGQRKSVPEIDFGINLRELTDSMIKMNNKDYFSYIRDDEFVKSDIEETWGFEGERYFENFDYKINDELKGVIFYKYKFKDKNDQNKYKIYSAAYRIRVNDKVIIVKYSYLGEDQQKFESLLADFEKRVLINLSLDKNKKKTNTNTVSSVSGAVIKEVKNIGKRLTGKIILQVESKGEAWYLSPGTGKAYFLGRPNDAYKVMREQGIGVSEKTYNSLKSKMPKNMAGKIILRVEAKGEAYYINPQDMKMYFLGKPEDAFQVMRKLGVGLSNSNFDNL